jgi:AbrB family looped-hinge helix DNA binding protein
MVRIEYERKVGPKGQIVIPKEIRRIMGILPETKVFIGLEGKKITIKLRKKDAIEEFLNLVPENMKKRITIEDIEKHHEEELEGR